MADPVTHRDEPTTQAPKGWREIAAREWLLFLALAALAGISLSVDRLPRVSVSELQVLSILTVLFIAVKGLEVSGLFAGLSAHLGRDRWIGPKLVAATFLMAMLATNDAALVVMVPLTLALEIGGLDRLVILEALAANAGSALTPFGNPQNLFIYWYYGLEPGRFVVTMAPFSGTFLALLFAAALPIKPDSRLTTPVPPAIGRGGYAYMGLLLVAILIVLRLLPITAGLAIPAYALLFDRASLRIDYGLLATFLCFFAIAEDLRAYLSPARIENTDPFLMSVAASQLLSNVPAALVMAKLTTHWKAVLWGTNAGGFGSLIGSLANLIAYRLYVAKTDRRGAAVFTAKFLAINLAALLIGAGLYYLAGPAG